MKTKYQVEITKIVDEKPVEYLLGDVNSLEELISNIDSFIERMKPLKKDKEIDKIVNKILN